jgi:uncharacterized protein
MATVTGHPTDGIVVRPLQFQVMDLPADDVAWSRTCPEFSVFINALGLHVPWFERYLIKALRKAKALDESAKAYFAARAESDSLKQLVGYTAGYETFTFLAGMIILEGYDRWFADSHPVMKAIWVWHQVEEVEHGAVAFDVFCNPWLSAFCR